VYKRLAYDAWKDRHIALRVWGPVRYPWACKGLQKPRMRDFKKFMTFLRWGHYLTGSIGGVPETKEFPMNRITLTASLPIGRAGNQPDKLLYVDLDLEPNFELLGNHTAEGIAKDMVKQYSLYEVFVEKFGAPTIQRLLRPSLLNPHVDAPDLDTIPFDLCYRFQKMAKASFTPERNPRQARLGQGSRSSYGKSSSGSSSGGSRRVGPLQIADMRFASPGGPPSRVPEMPFGNDATTPEKVAPQENYNQNEKAPEVTPHDMEMDA
jgi:hypothetical protein